LDEEECEDFGALSRFGSCSLELGDLSIRHAWETSVRSSRTPGRSDSGFVSYVLMYGGNAGRELSGTAGDVGGSCNSGTKLIEGFAGT
jgi:hypothetical protein